MRPVITGPNSGCGFKSPKPYRAAFWASSPQAVGNDVEGNQQSPPVLVHFAIRAWLSLKRRRRREGCRRILPGYSPTLL